MHLWPQKIRKVTEERIGKSFSQRFSETKLLQQTEQWQSWWSTVKIIKPSRRWLKTSALKVKLYRFSCQALASFWCLTFLNNTDILWVDYVTFRFYYETLTSYASVKSNRPHATGIPPMWCGVSLYVPHRGWGAYDASASSGGVRVLASRVINRV